MFMNFANLAARAGAAVSQLATRAVMLSTTAMPSFFTDALDMLKTVVMLIGGGLGVWGVINLLEGYGNDNPGAKSQGMKQLMAGIGIALVASLIPKIAQIS